MHLSNPQCVTAYDGLASEYGLWGGSLVTLVKLSQSFTSPSANFGVGVTKFLGRWDTRSLGGVAWFLSTYELSCRLFGLGQLPRTDRSKYLMGYKYAP